MVVDDQLGGILDLQLCQAYDHLIWRKNVGALVCCKPSRLNALPVLSHHAIVQAHLAQETLLSNQQRESWAAGTQVERLGHASSRYLVLAT